MDDRRLVRVARKTLRSAEQKLGWPIVLQSAAGWHPAHTHLGLQFEFGADYFVVRVLQREASFLQMRIIAIIGRMSAVSFQFLVGAHDQQPRQQFLAQRRGPATCR